MVLFLIPEIGNRGSQLVHNSFFCGIIQLYTVLPPVCAQLQSATR